MVSQTQVEEAVQPIINNEDKLQDKVDVEKSTETIGNVSTQQQQEEKAVVETAKILPPATDVSTAEVSMEMEDLVVHTVEDDFKIEEQSRDHVSKKSGEMPSSTTDEQVSNKACSYHGD